MGPAPEAGVHGAWVRARVGGGDEGPVGGLVDVPEEEDVRHLAGIAAGRPRVEHVPRRRPTARDPSPERLDGIGDVAPGHHPLVYVSRVTPLDRDRPLLLPLVAHRLLQRPRLVRRRRRHQVAEGSHAVHAREQWVHHVQMVQ